MPDHIGQALKGFSPLFILSQVVGIATVVLVFIWTVLIRGGFAWRSDLKLEFNWHILLLTVGMVYLGGNVNLVYRALRTSSKQGLKLTHAYMHGAILLMVLVGMVAAFDAHNLANPPKANLYSLHSWVGLLTVILYASQFVVGFFSFLYPGVAGSLRTVLMPYHVFSGVVIFIMSSCSVLTGIKGRKEGVHGQGDFLPNFIGLLVILYTILIGYLLCEPGYKRLPRVDEGGVENLALNGRLEVVNSGSGVDSKES